MTQEKLENRPEQEVNPSRISTAILDKTAEVERVTKPLYELPNGALTDLPAEVFSIREAGEDMHRKKFMVIDPLALETIPAGEYRLYENKSSGIVLGIVENETGKFIAAIKPDVDELFNAFEGEVERDETYDQLGARLPGAKMEHYTGFLRYAEPNVPKDGDSILEDFGFLRGVVNGKDVLMAPLPRTLARIAEAKDLPIRQIQETADKGDFEVPNGYAVIPDELFKQSYKDGFYPVGVADLSYYLHDVAEEDHFISMVVGGRQALGLISEHIGEDDVARSLDRLSGQLSEFIRDPTIASMTNAEGWLKEVSASRYKRGELTTLYVSKLKKLIDRGVITDESLEQLYMIEAVVKKPSATSPEVDA